MERAGWKRWVIDYEQPCEGCRYSLRGLRPGDRCPECGRTIPGFSPGEDRHLLHRADPTYLRRLRRGSLLLQACAVAMPAMPLLSLLGSVPREAIPELMLSIPALWCTGWWFAASPDHSQALTSPFNTSANAARSSAMFTGGTVLLTVLVVTLLRSLDVGTRESRNALVIFSVCLWLIFLGASVLNAHDYKDAVMARARRLLPARRRAAPAVWVTGALIAGGVVIPLYLFLRAGSLRRAATLALRSEPTG